MWCVKQVRYVFEEKFGNNPQLPNKDLTLKVFCAFKSTILLALRTSSRISALRILQLNYMIKTTEYYDIRLHKLYKSQRKDESPPSLVIYVFPSNKALCEVAALDCYYSKNINLEKKNQNSQLLVSFVKSLNTIAKSTLAGG